MQQRRGHSDRDSRSSTLGGSCESVGRHRITSDSNDSSCSRMDTKAATEAAHKVLAEEFIKFLSSNDMGNLPRWSTHNLRLIVMALLANPNCGKEADDLAALYDGINEATH
jgi:hypothetical protein